MTVGNISAFNQFIIPSVQNTNLHQYNTLPLSSYSKNSPVQTPVKLPELEDTNKDIKYKKLTVGLAAAAGIAAVALGGILIVSKYRQNKLYAKLPPVCEQIHNVFNISEKAQKLAPKIQDDAAETLKKAQASLMEVQSVFRKGSVVKDGISLVQIDENIMQEFDKDGKKLIRWSSFSEGTPTKIREYFADTNTYNSIFADEGGNIISVLAGCQNKPDRLEVAKEFLFDCTGNLKRYFQGVANKPELTKDAELRMDFISGKLASYTEKYHERPVFKCYNFKIDFEENGFVKTHSNVLHEYSNGSSKAASQILYINGDPVYYDTGCVKPLKGDRTYIDRYEIELKD